ncbi:maleylpyruvate isomerase family mycothiol-dependent enzyme [Kitasatospora xanthocidica]|uniref:maleylpyruvate isomerase family mycothiol-dependent enzyme n=1 Tax=Kitasatospora xanthocidica TaxID=83382 RepID=UPI0036ECA1E7
MTSPLDPARLVEGLREQTAAFARAATGQDPATPVPTCPGWSLRTLVGHLGEEHRWAAELVRTGEPLPAPDPARADPGPPAGWAEWLYEGAEDLVRAIQNAGPDAAVQTFLGPRPAVFCLRRMVSDTCVHHYDAAAATDSTFELPDDLAADTISETLDLLTTPALAAARPGLARLPGHGQRIGLRPRTAEGWVITRTPGAPRWDRGPVEAEVVVSGATADLLLVLSRRLPPTSDRVTVTGDHALLHHWLAHTAL